MGLQTTIRAISGAYEQIDHAISEALYQSKPVLIQVASNMASLTHPLFEEQPVPFSMTGKTTNEVSFIYVYLSSHDRPIVQGYHAGCQQVLLRLKPYPVRGHRLL